MTSSFWAITVANTIKKEPPSTPIALLTWSNFESVILLGNYWRNDSCCLETWYNTHALEASWSHAQTNVHTTHAHTHVHKHTHTQTHNWIHGLFTYLLLTEYMAVCACCAKCKFIPGSIFRWIMHRAQKLVEIDTSTIAEITSTTTIPI